MKIFGITGPTGAGKTTALHVLERMDVVILDCDAIYHDLLCRSEPLRRELTERFGDVFSHGILDRKKLGKQVWGDETALSDLNAITHKYIMNALKDAIGLAERQGRAGAAIDAVLLFESGAAELCDATIAIVAPEEVRMHRIMARESIPEDYARARIAAQHSGEWFSRKCSYTLENDSTAEAFAHKAELLFVQLLNE